MRYCLALDQSTSATKALLFDESGALLDRESREHEQHYPQAGWVEHDAEEIWINVLSVVGRLLERNQAKISGLVGLSITNQRETVLVFDRKSGKPFGRAIVWQCRRSEELCRGHRSRGADELLHQKTGLKIDPYFSGSKLQWLVQNNPAVRKGLSDGTLVAGTIDSYLVHRLTGGRVFATDRTNASRTLLYDIKTQTWDPELCALWEVPMTALPELRDSTARFGETDFGGLLAKPLPIVGIMGDSQAALLAQGCVEPGSGKATFGTGTSILLNIGAQPTLARSGVLTAVAWSHNGTSTYAFEGIVISSASTLTWLKDQLGLFEKFEETAAAANEVGDNEGVYLVPAFAGLGLPHWKPEARAAIVGLTSRADRRHLIRAGLESIAYQVNDVLKAMRTECGITLRGLSADGGATASDFLMQFTADITRTDLKVAEMSDCSAWGAVVAGLVGLGLRDFDGGVGGARTYRPQMKREKADSLIRGWDTAVGQVLSATPQKA